MGSLDPGQQLGVTGLLDDAREVRARLLGEGEKGEAGTG